MKNLTTPVQIPNVTKWDARNLNLDMGSLTIRVFYGGGTSRWADFDAQLSDVVAQSTGIAVNPSPQGVSDTVIRLAGVGPANALTNAVNAYNNASGGKSARMSAVETQFQVDGIVSAALVGT